ncbi:MAG TPA: BrnT family toxin [Thermoanaerobaculia bacterium]
MQFEWDPAKDRRNRARHRVAFEEAASVFGDPLAWTIEDPDHSLRETRYLTTGISSRARVLIVSHTYRAHRIRIISARLATNAERHVYEEGE